MASGIVIGAKKLTDLLKMSRLRGTKGVDPTVVNKVLTSTKTVHENAEFFKLLGFPKSCTKKTCCVSQTCCIGHVLILHHVVDIHVEVVHIENHVEILYEYLVDILHVEV